MPSTLLTGSGKVIRIGVGGIRTKVGKVIILLVAWIVIGLLAGWFEGFADQPAPAFVMIGTTILVAMLFGFASEAAVVIWRLRPEAKHRGRFVIRILGWNALAGLIVGGASFAILASPLLDAVGVLDLIVVDVAISVVGVVLLDTLVLPTRRAEGRTKQTHWRMFLVKTYAIQNLLSMAAGVGAGRLHLAIFYPGIG
jgi:hypothetical protein